MRTASVSSRKSGAKTSTACGSCAARRATASLISSRSTYERSSSGKQSEDSSSPPTDEWGCAMCEVCEAGPACRMGLQKCRACICVCAHSLSRCCPCPWLCPAGSICRPGQMIACSPNSEAICAFRPACSSGELTGTARCCRAESTCSSRPGTAPADAPHPCAPPCAGVGVCPSTKARRKLLSRGSRCSRPASTRMPEEALLTRSCAARASLVSAPRAAAT
mmetsp:Transcript_8926/g.19623  ORF Transcript_8926/g.19623 Transcript_8926/m.19623 type:complete len:221 (-) Transcript_8926:1499-2161(-)